MFLQPSTDSPKLLPQRTRISNINKDKILGIFSNFISIEVVSSLVVSNWLAVSTLQQGQRHFSAYEEEFVSPVYPVLLQRSGLWVKAAVVPYSGHTVERLELTTPACQFCYQDQIYRTHKFFFFISRKVTLLPFSLAAARRRRRLKLTV